MMKLFLICAFLVCAHGFVLDYSQRFEPSNVHLDSDASAGEALYLSKYLEQPDLGQKLSRVEPLCEACGDPYSYSGFFTVNETTDSHLFYWFFPAQNGDTKAPLLVWLQGGPGSSSLFGLFAEVGPYNLTKNLTLVPKPITWNSKYAMIFIDNPVGAGFSYTTQEAGYSNNEDEIANNLYSLLSQFFKIYYQYQPNDFYVTGESYAGKYIPAIGYKIHTENQKGSKPFINLKGLSIGDGLCDPVTQVTAYANTAYYMGLVDELEKEKMDSYADKMVQSVKAGEWQAASDYFNDLINGGPYISTYFLNVTGLVNYYDIRLTYEPSYTYNYVAFVNSSDVRRKLHVGDHFFQVSDNVYPHLELDMMKSIKPLLPTLLNNYKVLFYNGQFDFIVAAPTTEAFISTIPWSGINGYKNAKKVLWKVDPTDKEIAGYVRNYQSLTQIVVRNAGHILPYDQPRAAFDMIDRFIQDKPYN